MAKPTASDNGTNNCRPTPTMKNDGTNTATMQNMESRRANAVRLQAVKAASAPTVASVRSTVVPQLARTETGFKAGSVGTVHRMAGPAIRITYLARGKADPVTGKTRVDAVERYLFFHNGREAVLTLSGPKGADNVDPWRIITNSLRWTR